ncbi:MAG: hypothetical protein RJA70_4917 [Pseudomonadota bacterium]
MGKLRELRGWAIELLNEDAVQRERVQVWIESKVTLCTAVTVPLWSLRCRVLGRWVASAASASPASSARSCDACARVMRASGPMTSRMRRS